MDFLGAHFCNTLDEHERESYYENKIRRWLSSFLVVIGHSSGYFLEMLLLIFTPYWTGICWRSLPLIGTPS